MTAATVGQALRAAAALIAERGLAKYSELGPLGELDVYGALGVAIFGTPVVNGLARDGDLFDQARMAIITYVDPFPGFWNDAPHRTWDEVVATLRTLADQLEPEAVSQP